MALVVFLRGVNVGGHRTFRPSILAKELSDYGVVNVGAAGTFVVRKPGTREKFRAELLRKLPFDTEVVLCDGRDLIRMAMENPFGAETARSDIVRFVSILSKDNRAQANRAKAKLPKANVAKANSAKANVSKTNLAKADRGVASIPCAFPPSGEWYVRVIASKKRFVFGEYRRHMKTIGYLGQIDKMFGGRATTRNWNTIATIVQILKTDNKKDDGKKTDNKKEKRD
jgi:uncharacterized protein (DUF1697 family)